MYIAFFRVFAILVVFLSSPTLTVANDILRVQKLLSELGYELGTPDGVFGTMSKNALERYSQDRGMAYD